MALQSVSLTLSPQSIRSQSTIPYAGKYRINVSSITSTCNSNSFCFKENVAVKLKDVISSKRRDWTFRVRSSLDIAGATVGQVTEVNKDTFWTIIKAAGDKTVVLDMYTQWCGPCKVMAPKFEKLSEKYLDVVFLKLDCNQENKPLAKELGIRVVPAFKILKDNKVVKEVTGAKFDDLIHAIDTVRSS